MHSLDNHQGGKEQEQNPSRASQLATHVSTSTQRHRPQLSHRCITLSRAILDACHGQQLHSSTIKCQGDQSHTGLGGDPGLIWGSSRRQFTVCMVVDDKTRRWCAPRRLWVGTTPGCRKRGVRRTPDRSCRRSWSGPKRYKTWPTWPFPADHWPARQVKRSFG